MSDYETILHDVQDGIATVTLNRPERLNAYVPQMGVDIVDAFAKMRHDDDVRVVILTGAGKGFCSGVDLDALKAQQAGESTGPGPKLGEEAFLRTFPPELLEYPKPVIAALNGAAVGVGITMVLPCDIRIANEDAKLGLPFTRLGILPGLGGTYLLSRIVGEGRARELVLTARLIRGREAAEIGLVNKAVPAGEVMNAAREMAAEMVACDPDALALAKQTLSRGPEGSMRDALGSEKRASDELAARRAARRPA